MSGLWKGMMGFLAIVCMLFSYNILGNRPLRKLNTDSEEVLAANALRTKLWGRPSPPLQPCWTKPPRKTSTRKEWGYVLVTCSHGPHHHQLQIANAVMVARQLGATLVVPTIRDSLTDLASNFDDIYNVKHFVASLEGVVKVTGRLPDALRKRNLTNTELPHALTKAYVEERIRPVFEANQVILLRFRPGLKGVNQDEELRAIRCLVQHRALVFASQIEKLAKRLHNRMMEAGREDGGSYLAVDYRSGGQIVGDSLLSRSVSPHALGLLLQRHGFPPATAVYVTQTRLDASVEPLLSLFPNVISKEYTMPFNEENQVLSTGKRELDLAVDFYVCSRSRVFVPVSSGTFYAAVAGERIQRGLTHMLVPTDAPEPVLTLAPSHPAHSCFCHQGVNREIDSIG